MVLNNLLNSANEQISSITGDPDEGGSNSFRKTLTENEFIDGKVDIVTGQFQKIGQFIVPAQEQYRWGSGSAEFEANQGYLYVALQDASGNAVDGALRLQQRDSQERNIITVYEEDTKVLDGSKTDRAKQQALPLQADYPRVGRDSKLVLALDPNADGNVQEANSEMLLPVTVYPT